MRTFEVAKKRHFCEYDGVGPLQETISYYCRAGWMHNKCAYYKKPQGGGAQCVYNKLYRSVRGPKNCCDHLTAQSIARKEFKTMTTKRENAESKFKIESRKAIEAMERFIKGE